MNKHQSRTPGVCLTICACFFFLGAAFVLVRGNAQGSDSQNMGANENAAFDALQSILHGQNAFYESDHHQGVPSYAPFVVHMHHVPGTKNKLNRLGFISRDIGFAMGPDRAFHGYYFEDVRYQELPPANQNQSAPLDYQKQWCIAALPAEYGTSGRLILMVNQDGTIIARNPGYVTVPQAWPLDPESQGWSHIGSQRDLDAIRP
jgi:hypothetical protein